MFDNLELIVEHTQITFTQVIRLLVEKHSKWCREAMQQDFNGSGYYWQPVCGGWEKLPFVTDKDEYFQRKRI